MNTDSEFLNALAKNIVDVTPGLITVFNPTTGKYNYVNNAVYSILGYSIEDILNGGFLFTVSLLHPDEADSILKKNQDAIQTANTQPGYDDNTIIEFEYRMRHKSGHYIWLHTYAVVFSRDGEGSLEKVLNISVDITDRKNAEILNQQLKISEVHFRELSDKVPFMIWKVDEHGKANYVNKTWVDFTGLSYENSLEYLWKEALHPEDQPAEQVGFRNALADKVPYHSKFRLLRKDGTYRWVLNQSNPLFNPTFAGYIGSLTDITNEELVRLEREQIMKKKDEFLSIASHELKTPITSMKASLQIVERLTSGNPETVAIHNFIEKANKQVTKLTSLVDDLLDVTKIQAGKMEFNTSNFLLKEAITDCLDQISSDTSSQQIIVEGQSEILINGDKNRLEQVITNFISNAIKYSPESDKIIINVASSDSDVTISVTDFGIGIPGDKIPFVFDRFFRVAESANKFSGLGLGLYISNEIIMRHDGTIGVSSEEGNGSTFWFTLPINNIQKISMEKSQTLVSTLKQIDQLN